MWDDFAEEDSENLGPNDFEPESGEEGFDYTDVDFTRLGEVNLVPGGELFVDVYAEPGYIPFAGDISFSGIEELLGIEPDEIDEINGIIQPMGDDINLDADTMRGPFVDKEHVKDWLDQTGLWGVVSIYEGYDEDLEDYFYYVDIDGTP